MRQPLLLTLLLAGLIGLAAPAQAHGRHGHQAHVKPFVQVVPWPDGYWQDYMLRPWRMVPPMLGHRHATPRALRMTPWHYHPEVYCPPPYCLPSYHRHRLPALSPATSAPRADPAASQASRLSQFWRRPAGRLAVLDRRAQPLRPAGAPQCQRCHRTDPRAGHLAALLRRICGAAVRYPEPCPQDGAVRRDS
jgi:hypothetical protein